MKEKLDFKFFNGIETRASSNSSEIHCHLINTSTEHEVMSVYAHL